LSLQSFSKDTDRAGPTDPRDGPLRPWERAGLGLVLIATVAFGVLVERRAAFSAVRMTDVGVYLRAGWSVRTGADVYSIPDDRGWHYAYPPVFAVLMVPLADAPADVPRDGMLPYAVSVAIWYAASVLAMWFAADRAAAALGPEVRYSRRWWYRRVIPIYVLIAPIGSTLARGQVNLFLLALCAGWYADLANGRRFRSGLWLAGAVCLKLFPAYLAVLPLRRRDGRALAGLAAGLVVGIVIVPGLVWGPTGAVAVNRRLVDAVILPGLGAGGDPTRDLELMNVTATDNQSIQAIVHNYRHWQRPRPTHPDPATKLAHVLIAGGLTLATLLIGARVETDRLRLLVVVGALVLLLAVCSPVSHLHYPCLALFLVMGLVESSWRRHPDRLLPDRATLAVLAFAALCFTLPMIPVWEHRREAGLPLLGVLVLWGAGMARIRPRR
jgi:alpha-1,2-mannosyltransferase